LKKRENKEKDMKMNKRTEKIILKVIKIKEKRKKNKVNLN